MTRDADLDTSNAVPWDEAADSAATHVTFYEDRAAVARRATVTLGAGTQRVLIAGVTPYVDDRSLQIRAVDAPEGLELLTARVIRRAIPREEDAALVASLEAEERAMSAELRLARRARERARLALNHARDLLAAWTDQVGSATRDPASSPEGWGDAYRTLDQAHRRRLQSWLERRHAYDTLHDTYTRLMERLSQARAQEPLIQACVEAQVRADAEVEATLELLYRTPCALWRPEHIARLVGHDDGDGQPATIQWTAWAVVWQHTGERWDDVAATFSTARPAGASRAPLLAEDVLIKRRKTTDERQTVRVEARDQAIESARDGAGDASADQLPGVDDGGRPLQLDASSPVTLPSDGRPVRVLIAALTLDADVQRVAYPERSPAAHLRASTKLDHTTPLLAGPLRLAREAGFVGLARQTLVAPGEPFVVGFGADDSVRVRRRVERTQDRTPVTGTQKHHTRVRLFLSNLSDTPRRVLLTERLPVSEIEGVEVELQRAEGWSAPDPDGMITYAAKLAPRATLKLKLTYTVKARSNVQLSL